MTHDKISRSHLQRDAIVYIRQSSTHQVRYNQESRKRQYALTDRAQALGWKDSAIQTIDEDQGCSGTSASHRQGFKKLLAEIGAGQVGLVLALEASRLTRSSADWHRLVEICVVTRTLLADESAVYDPRDPNDRLLLGVKGTLSEAELFTLKQRLHEGRWNKAQRGELQRSLPVGYVRREDGEVAKDPDRQVQLRINYLFELFAQLRVARQVIARLRAENLKIPCKVWGGPRHGEVVWKQPELSALIRLLHNPTYAGRYVYGQSEYDTFDRSPTNGKAKVHKRDIEDWSVCLADTFPAYISWEEFLENQKTLHDNWYRSDRRGSPRKGQALLQGIVFCGHCGARMQVNSYSRKEQRSCSYGCYRDYQQHGGKTCQTMSARNIDEAVAELFLKAVSPAQMEIALQAIEELETRHHETARQWEADLQRAEYEVELARRRYEAADPDNRLVASELETTWEQALQSLETRRREQKVLLQQQAVPFSARDRQLVKKLSADLETVWRAETTTMPERKTLLRFLVKRVHLDGVSEDGKIRIEVEWQTGSYSSLVIDRLPVGVWAPKTSSEVEQRLQELLPTQDYSTIAETLNQEGYRSAKGLTFNQYTVGYIARTRGWNRSRNTKSKPR